MNYFDIVIIIPLIWGAYKGFRKGLVIELASFIALGLGIWGGVKFSSFSAHYLSEVIQISEKVMPLISFSITFILIVVVVFFIAKMIERIIKFVALGFFNKAFGSLFGMLKFGLIISVVLNLVNLLNTKVEFISPTLKDTSLLYIPVSKIGAVIVPELKNINEIVDNPLMGQVLSTFAELN